MPSYLTYAMMHFVFKHKISEKDNSSDEALTTDITCATYYQNDEDGCNSICIASTIVMIIIVEISKKENFTNKKQII